MDPCVLYPTRSNDSYRLHSFLVDSDALSTTSLPKLLFSSTTDLETLVEFVKCSCLDESVYLVMAPYFKPENLLLPSKVTEEDLDRGKYMDVFTDVPG